MIRSNADCLWHDITQTSVSLLTQKEELKPEYSEISYLPKITFNLENSQVKEFRYIKKILMRNETIIKQLSRIINRPVGNRPKVQIVLTDVTQKSFALPNSDAIKLIAHHYAEKYLIPIVVSDLENVGEVINCFKQKSLIQSFYVGIVIRDDRFWDHAIPILIYFGQDVNQNPLVECALMDSYQTHSKNHVLYAETIDYFKKNMGDLVNQVYSCTSAGLFLPNLGPTRATVLLRNTLLYLKNEQTMQPLHEILKDFLIQETDTFAFLPPQWTYTDQRVDKRGENLPVIRNLFSSSLNAEGSKKCQKTYTLENFRIKNQISIELRCEILLTGRGLNTLADYPKVNFLTAGTPGPNQCTITMKVKEFSFAYLYNKAWRNKRALEESQKNMPLDNFSKIEIVEEEKK
jgi:hypothetical protein